MAAKKTLAMRLLDGKQIPYEALGYDSNERDAVQIALQLEVPPEQVFKTLVLSPPAGPRRKPLLAILPANRQLDLKKVANLINVKKIRMATHQQAEQLTGLQVGGISPLALLNKGFAIFLDASAFDQPCIYISAGERGIQLKLTPSDLYNVLSARLADLS